jgi:hypothetical protein
MTQHGYLNAEEIEIEVNNGQVILKGSVDSRREKRLAEDMAESVPGINQVINQLQVKSKQPGQPWAVERSSQQQMTEETEQGTSA